MAAIIIQCIVIPGMLLALPSVSATQAPARRTSVVIGGAIGGQYPSHAPLSAPQLFGLSAGMESALWRSIALRASASWLRSYSARDGISPCIGPEPQYGPPNNCFEPAYATWYWVLAGDAQLRPLTRVPLYASGGVGWTAVSSKAYSWGRAPTEDSPLKASALYRFGWGVILGRSVHAPRVEMINTHFMNDVGTAQRLVAVQLLLRL